jgi:hypothetical protein
MCGFVFSPVSSNTHTCTLTGFCPTWSSGLLGVSELFGGVAEDRRMLWPGTDGFQHCPHGGTVELCHRKGTCCPMWSICVIPAGTCVADDMDYWENSCSFSWQPGSSCDLMGRVSFPLLASLVGSKTLPCLSWENGCMPGVGWVRRCSTCHFGKCTMSH